MQSRADYGAAYAAAFALRDEMEEFLLEIGERRGWSLVAKILGIRFRGALVAFLDSPTHRTLGAVLDFQAEIARVDRNLPGKRTTSAT